MLGKYIEENKSITCAVCDQCGGCCYTSVSYDNELRVKQKKVNDLFKDIIKPEQICGMYRPVYYRNKVHRVFGKGKNSPVIAGIYKEGTHKLIPVNDCMIEDQDADRIIEDIRKLCESFKYEPYNEDSGHGFMRHVLVRKGFSSKQIMVVLVTSDVAFPSKNNFLKELKQLHPEITTIVQNINGMNTNMILGKRNIVHFGKGYIEDVLCGCRFRISPESFYQINCQQTEKLYKAAIKAADITTKDTVIDAYCGIGTIGISLAKKAGNVIGVELNTQAVRDAAVNAEINGIKNIRFVNEDAGHFLENWCESGKADVVILDPPRSGCDEVFLNSLITVKPKKIIYISCNPETQARDIKILMKKGYSVMSAQPFDMFPHTDHVENVCLLSNKP